MGKRYYYAEIDENNIAFSLLDAPTPSTFEKHIELESYDISVLGKKYNGGVWEEIPVDEVPAEPTQFDRIEAAVNKSQQEIIDEYTLELMEGGII